MIRFRSTARRKAIAVVGVAAAVIAVCIAAPSAVGAAPADTPTVTDLGASSSPSGATCQSYYFNIKQTPSSTTRQRVWGQFCHRGALSSATPVQILIEGGSYNHTYWDPAYKPATYSYVEAATNHGYATLNIDRLGYGLSDHPNPLTLNFNVAGFVTHQLVSALRAGEIGPAFKSVILNGHSMGGLTAENEAANYQDVNGIILTGIGHDIALAGLVQVADKFYPATLDPKFGLSIPAGYLTTIPGDRAATFISPGTYDPGIVPYEETVEKDTLSPTELTGVTLDTEGPALTEKIHAPVLFAQGQYDLIWCARTGDCNTDPEAAAEKSFYDPSTSFTHVIIPNAGHSVNSSITAPVFYNDTFSWLEKTGLSPAA